MSQKSLPPKPPPQPDKDRLFSQHQGQAFQFDDKVVKVFPDMINRSVPGYNLIVPMLGLLARRFVQADSKVYDLGSSLGAASLAVRHAIKTDAVEIIAVDNSTSMVDKFRELLQQDPGSIPVDVRLMDIEDCETVDASLVILNFTLQFIDRDKRLPLLQRIYKNLKPGGALLLSEKICFEDPQSQQLQIDWHHDFKRSQGYSDLEVANKRNALENVLIPESLETHRQRLEQAGFETIIPWFQCFNFISLVAIKAK
jgi:tRNA (cmo5U34)-methyltransferase